MKGAHHCAWLPFEPPPHYPPRAIARAPREASASVGARAASLPLAPDAAVAPGEDIAPPPPPTSAVAAATAIADAVTWSSSGADDAVAGAVESSRAARVPAWCV